VRYVYIIPILLAATASLKGDSIIIDFEDLTDSTPVTTQYAGLTFSDTTVITAGISLNEFEFPPHSGTNVAFDDGGPISIFSDTPIESFGAYFTYTEALTLTAFDSLGDTVGTATSAFSNNLACLDGPPCQGDPGSSPNEFIQIALDQTFVHITIQGDPGGTSFTMDDVTYETVPESRFGWRSHFYS
jgi:hypothetical protein